MHRYFIVIWNVNNASDRDTASSIRRRTQNSRSGWQSALDCPGIYVAYLDQDSSSDATIQIDNCRGVILGEIYRSPGTSCSSGPRQIRHLSKTESEQIVLSTGRSLISTCWGNYVAAIHYPESSSAIVLRSPVSPLACFRVDRGSLSVFFSHLDDCIDLEISPLSVNWDSVTAQVIGGDYLTNETGINEITSLECGECVECNPNGRLTRSYWDPRSFLEDRFLVSFDEAAQAVRQTTDYCVSALSSLHDRILVKISGGLDSSIVLNSLARAPHKPLITAVNYYSKGSGDERRFARIMAGAVGSRLIEHSRNGQLDLRRFLDCNRTVRPVLQFSAPDVETRNIAIARELNAGAIFDGELGDNVFGSYPSPGALVESFRQHGLGCEFLGVAMDYAMLTRQSLWRALASVRRESRSSSADPDFSSSKEIQRVLGTDRARSSILASMEAEEHNQSLTDRFLHPWLRRSRRLAPGSQALLFGLITVTSATYHSPFSQPHDPGRVSPLVSQPLLEIALRIPTHLHCKFAQDRAVARAAFEDVLPPEILQRGLGKGGPGLWIKEVIDNNTEFLREFLLDGVLARRRLIDRNKLETVLSPDCQVYRCCLRYLCEALYRSLA